MDEKQLGPIINTTPVQRFFTDGTFPSGYSSASATERSWVQTPVGAICRTVGSIRATIKNSFFCFFCIFGGLILSLCWGPPRMQG